jgi:hypothetical protein
MARVEFLAGSRDFLFSIAFRLALGAIKPHSEWVLGAFSPGRNVTEE